MIISIIFHILLLLIIVIGMPLKLNIQKDIQYVKLSLDISGSTYNSPIIEQVKPEPPKVQPKQESKKVVKQKTEVKKTSVAKKEVILPTNKKTNEIQTPVNETTTSENKDDTTEQEQTDQLVDELLSSTPVKKATVTNKISWEQGKSRQVIFRLEPVLPEKYKKLGFNITGIVSFEINKYGHVSYTYITKSTGYVELDTILRETMEKWKFNPVLDDISAIGSITFVFNFQ